ncbi:hypothetical protein A3466_07890 [Enterobacter genomosp. S]|uniref:Uncharacterized protein n=1 Tax=Enterobacter genomosp. S TaxID=2364151 RepID=A0ABR5YJC2_9ENTR|nr:hypothetical protein A3466_07890 [Enterobacter genomosp. S]
MNQGKGAPPDSVDVMFLRISLRIHPIPKHSLRPQILRIKFLKSHEPSSLFAFSFLLMAR